MNQIKLLTNGIFQPLSDTPKSPLQIALLGASGSIGKQASALLQNRSDVRVKVLSGGKNAKAIQAAINALKPQIVLADEEILSSLCAPKVLPNSELASVIASSELDAVLNATSGFAGLNASLAAARAQIKLLLANKESLVIASHLLDELCAQIAPIDSEHSALAALAKDAANIDELIITASGGAFLRTELCELENISPQAALKHPNWSMGAKITIDSATMANKLYEIAEARALFKTDKITAFIEPSSIVHALVRSKDASVRMYASAPSMSLAIASAIFGEANFAACSRLEIADLSLNFMRINTTRYPLWQLKDELIRRAELGVLINAADEVAVDYFLRRKCGFLDIHRAVFAALDKFSDLPKAPDFATLCEIDKCVRAVTAEFLGKA